jgi:excisionase family DNA binding protein
MAIAADRFLTIDEVAEALHVSTALVKHLIRDKRLAALRMGHKTVRIRASALAKYIESLPPAPYPRVAR